ncbi:hypothetical protein KAI87_10825, partial [Myxococcota bacterium]|nr:hypothetical protein [Myxococcota bacterium]
MRKILSFLAVSLFAFSASANVTLVGDNSLMFTGIYSDQNTEWVSMTQSFGYTDFVTPFEASGAVHEVKFTTSVSASTESGGIDTVALRPAAYKYNSLLVNGDTYSNNGVGTLDCSDGGSDRQLNLEVQLMDGFVADALNVWRKVYISQDGYGQWVTFIKNTGSVSENVTVTINSYLQSSTRTKITASASDGLSPLGTDDGWFVTGGDYSDPRVAHVIAGPAGLKPSAITVEDCSEIVMWAYNFDLEADETIALVNFVTATGFIDESVTIAKDIYGDSASYLGCLSADELAMIANFQDCSTLNTDCETFSYDATFAACKSTAVDCSGLEDQCNGSTCTEDVGCVAVPLSVACDDGDSCTLSDTCAAGACVGVAKDCSAEADQCNAGSCDSTLGCVADPLTDGISCNDLNLCTDTDVCSAGVCFGVAKDCSAQDATCYNGQCNAETGSCEAVLSPAGTACDDGEECTEDDACDSAGLCVSDDNCVDESSKSDDDSDGGCGCSAKKGPVSIPWMLFLGAAFLVRRR